MAGSNRAHRTHPVGKASISRLMAVSNVFKCAQCAADAGSVTVYARGEPIPAVSGDELDMVSARVANRNSARPRLEVRSGLGSVTVFEFDLDSTLAALAAGDGRTLHAIDVEIVPFWCPRCGTSYCAEHWTTWDLFDEGFFDQKRGRCPKGHERMLLD
jgi:hypothetical protein